MDYFCLFFFNVPPPQMVTPESRSPHSRCLCSTLRTLKLHLTKPVSVDFPILTAPWDCLQPAMAVALRGVGRSLCCLPTSSTCAAWSSTSPGSKAPRNEGKNSRFRLYFFNLSRERLRKRGWGIMVHVWRSEATL